MVPKAILVVETVKVGEAGGTGADKVPKQSQGRSCESQNLATPVLADLGRG
jgi:hypothetical protein